MIKKKVKEAVKRLPKRPREFKCPNCGTPFTQAEDEYTYKGNCAHFPRNLRIAFA
jgi:transcription elongation factor Elf1